MTTAFNSLGMPNIDMFDLVLFAGSRSLELKKLVDWYPKPESPGYYNIVYKENNPLDRRERSVIGIDRVRIFDYPVSVGNKMTLVVFTQLGSQDVNESLMDLTLMDTYKKMQYMQAQLDNMKNKLSMYNEFIKAEHIESKYENFARNNINLLASLNKNIIKRDEPAQNVEVSLGKKDKDKKKN